MEIDPIFNGDANHQPVPLCVCFLDSQFLGPQELPAEIILVYISFLEALYLGEQNECIKNRKRKPDFTNSQNLSKTQIISMGRLKNSGSFGRPRPVPIPEDPENGGEEGDQRDDGQGTGDRAREENGDAAV